MPLHVIELNVSRRRKVVVYLHSIKENLTAESLADRPRVPVCKLSGYSGQDLSDAKADSSLKLGLTPGSAAERSFSIEV